MMLVRTLGIGLAVWAVFAWSAAGAEEFEHSIRPLLKEYCLTCHSTAKQEGELDLERFTDLKAVKQDASVWEHAQEQLSLGEMPPKKAKQLSAVDKRRLVAWIQATLREAALENAGDPGPVVLRRLSNAEYTYTLRDLTGVDSLDPAREFPVDGAAGEGFTNAGAGLVMSPTLLGKYLDAAKEVAGHTVLLPDGIRFSATDSPQDWTNETLAAIRALYHKHTVGGEATATVAQGIKLDTGTGDGRLPLAKYLDALQGRGDDAGLSAKYLGMLRAALEGTAPLPLLDPLREKFRAGKLTAADVEPWQKALWRFTHVGHIGKLNGPKAWQEPVTPLVAEHEIRVKLDGAGDQTLYLVTGDAGDGNTGDDVLWEKPRLVAKGRPDLPADDLPALERHLEIERKKILSATEACLAVLAGADESQVDPDALAAWRDYLGIGAAIPEPLLSRQLGGNPDYPFIRGWLGDNALSVVANSSDATVRIPGVMKGHSVAVHPSPSRAVVIAWRSPTAATLRIDGNVVHAHPECGNGVTWSLEVSRGRSTEVLASGPSERAKLLPLGPFESVRVAAGDVVSLVVAPRDGNHSCDLTAVNLTLSDGRTTWDLAKDVSPNILAGNPHGPWHFTSRPMAQEAAPNLPEPIAAWRAAPSAASAKNVREYLERDFPLDSPLLSRAVQTFRPSGGRKPLLAKAPSVAEWEIPAFAARGAEFVVTGRLASSSEGSVQMRVLTQKPEAMSGLVAGAAETTAEKARWSDGGPVTRNDVPIIVNDGTEARKRFEAAFDEFRALFPVTVCYPRIVPVDEVVTLTLFYREDHELKRLLLDDAEARLLDRLWDELLFVSQSPLKQVDAFEQLWQYATQDADPKAFEPMRKPILEAAEAFKKRQAAADAAQRQAVIEFAARAWRRPLTESEIANLKQFSPRLMLARVITSPAFLYRGERTPVTTGPVDDWELATRLSYFLWSSAPDDELRRLAAAGRLRDPDVLAAQARRMLRDEKIRRLGLEFGCQWLHVRDLDTLEEKSERHFPTFVALRADMREEIERFFTDVFQNDRSVLGLLDSDHTFVNDALAAHYGLKAAFAANSPDDWRRVDGVAEQGRGGILGFAGTLARHSGASRTSAILRGTWLSETILGDKFPKPPKDVPVLPEEPPAGLSERQLIERHSSDAACASCHRRFDPYGFALEGFDAIGRARSADTQTTLYDGTAIRGLGELKRYLLTERRDDFLRQFSRKLVGYALGRSVQLSDQPLIDAMVRSKESRVADLVELIVRSPQFRQIRGSGVTARY